MKRLIAYRLSNDGSMSLRPGVPSREWMDETDERFAYRCPPLVLSNSWGWEVVLEYDVEASWLGGDDERMLSVEEEREQLDRARSHFGHGVLSFRIPYLFRTPEGWNLLVRGPPNTPREHVDPLSGVVETDHTAAPFTMNYRFTTPGVERFEAGDAIAFLTPVPRGIDEWQPEVRELSSAPELAESYGAWRESRDAFIEELREQEPDAGRTGFQGDYVDEARQPRLRLPAFDRDRLRELSAPGNGDS